MEEDRMGMRIQSETVEIMKDDKGLVGISIVHSNKWKIDTTYGYWIFNPESVQGTRYDIYIYKLFVLEDNTILYRNLISYFEDLFYFQDNIGFYQKVFGDIFCELAAHESQQTANEVFTMFGDIHRMLGKKQIHKTSFHIIFVAPNYDHNVIAVRDITIHLTNLANIMKCCQEKCLSIMERTFSNPTDITYISKQVLNYEDRENLLHEELTNRGNTQRHYLSDFASCSGDGSSKRSTSEDADMQMQATQRQFINSYFNRFLKLDFKVISYTFKIFLDLNVKYLLYYLDNIYSTITCLYVDLGLIIYILLIRVPPWLIRHFQYAVQLSHDFLNELKFKKMKEIRKVQRELPISERKQEILSLLEKNQVPQYLINHGYTGIACTQPRRIACTALSRRVAYETLSAYGSDIAYQIRLVKFWFFLFIYFQLIDKQIPSTERGDALIFLNGVAEISTVAEALKTYAELTKGWIILMLHSTLSVEEQDKVFDVAPTGIRKCILSTNIAETSVTIDGIRFVIDSGKHEVYQSKEEYDFCENLFYSFLLQDEQVELAPASVTVFTLKNMDPRTFPYIERPVEDKLNEALEILKFQVCDLFRLGLTLFHTFQILNKAFQGVIYGERENKLTALGNAVAKLPVDVSIAKAMLIFGCVVDQLEVMLTVSAGFSVQSLFTNRSYRELKIVERRASLTNPLGDPFTLIEVFSDLTLGFYLISNIYYYRQWVMQKTIGGQSRRWTVENGIDEHRLYEISKLRAQYRQILEDAGIIERGNIEYLEENDTRQRRIDQGDRKKLFDMKRNVLLLYKIKIPHCIFQYFHLENEKDPMKTDVNTVEFLLSHKQRDVDNVRKTHKLRRNDAEVIRLVIAAGLYPQYAVLDNFNKYQQGQELFVHTRLKPFSLIHPNSSVAQYHPETLDARPDHDGLSSLHKIPFYGLLLETTKPYICNVLALPALELLLVAKKVNCENWKLITVDDFLEFAFLHESQCMNILKIVEQIRKEMSKGLQKKLCGADFCSRELVKFIEKMGAMLSSEGVQLGIKRLVNPPRLLENVGFFHPDGEIIFDGDMGASEEESYNDVEWNQVPGTDSCNSETEDKEMIREMEPIVKKPKEESYYEKLLKRQKDRETRNITEQKLDEKESKERL
uniref:Helicase C-terminal domain-containing protein n=1 Tax=Heterorhabditis bacteriophora TaxID=37862 RepID=A0A1I7WZ41_HETBA